MSKRLSKGKQREILVTLLLKKVNEYRKYQYQKKPKKEFLIKQLETGENIEVIKFREWYKERYNNENDMWQKEIVIEYIIYSQIWAIRRNQKSKETKHIYTREAIWFSKYLAHKFKLEDYRRVQDKHIESYVKSLIQQGIKPITIQKKLYGIYYYHAILKGLYELKPIKEVINDDKILG